MEFVMIDAFKGANGKLCEHSDMGATYNNRTGKTYSHKLCNKRDLNTLPYSDKELSAQAAFKTRSAAVSATVKSLTDAQRRALVVLRNERGLYGIRELVDGIYDKDTKTVPASALAELVALGTKSASASSNSSSSTGGGGSSGGSSGGDDEGGM